jgi:DNA mismatch repair protein MutH
MDRFRDTADLLKKARWLEGKTLAQVMTQIKQSDSASRVKTKGNVGYVIEEGYFGIAKNSKAESDLKELGVEIKTCPLKYNSSRNRLSVKEPLSLNIINYVEEAKHNDIRDSSFYKKNKKMLLVLYIHDKNKKRSEYLIERVLLWEMTDDVLEELKPDYEKIINKIRQGKAHEIHQSEHKYLTLCPKHCGNFKDPNCKISKRQQPYSDILAEVRAFRLKNRYMNKVISELIDKKLEKGGWAAD